MNQSGKKPNKTNNHKPKNMDTKTQHIAEEDTYANDLAILEFFRDALREPEGEERTTWEQHAAFEKQFENHPDWERYNQLEEEIETTGQTLERAKFPPSIWEPVLWS